MRHSYIHESIVDSAPERLYAALTDIRRWPEWDDGLAATRQDGDPVTAGSTFSLTPKGGRPIAMTVVAAEAPHLFVDRAHLPLGWIETRHEFHPQPDGRTRVRHAVRAGGPLGFLWHRVVARKLAADHPTQLPRLAAHAARRP